MENMKQQKWVYIPVLILIVCLMYLSINNFNTVKNYCKSMKIEKIEDLTNGFEGNIQSKLKQKNFFINLNGLMYKFLHINTLNQVEKLENGWLITNFTKNQDPKKWIAKEEELSNYLKEQNILYLCVPIPNKGRYYDAKESKGYSDYGKKTAMEFNSWLTEKGVPNLNMNQFFIDNNWTVKDIFFKTDHHWKPEAAFVATEQINKKLAEMDNSVVYAPEFFLDSNWNKDIFKDWFLGSAGKRVGSKYTGVDDFSFIYPKFETDFACRRIEKNGRNLVRDYVDTPYYLPRSEKKDYFNLSPYSVYLGGDYPIVCLKNKKAKSQKKVVIIGDSFKIPVVTFLSTIFSEVYSFDSRHYQDGTFIEYVNSISPNIVISLYYETYNNATTKYDVASWQKNFGTKEEKILVTEEKNILLSETTSDTDYTVFATNVGEGSYEIDVGSVNLEHNFDKRDQYAGDLVMAAVINTKNGSIQKARYFISDYPEEQKWYFTVPKNTNANFAVVFYNGMNKITLGNTTTLSDVSMYQYQ